MADRTKEIFDKVLAMSAEDRAAFLEAACANDATLRADVESLLACYANLAKGDDAFLKSPLVREQEPTDREPGESRAHPLTLSTYHLVTSSQFGRYRVLRALGVGGMGAVYEAEQDSPHRSVALKVMRPGLLSPALLKRFTHEAEILGRLHHAGIAQIYEAGTAEDGQPFFAMEFIHGLPLDEYANQNALGVTARVGLVARVCDAVQHAHDRGVIHRDLKPANILVEEGGQPKVLDFGVARATDADLITSAGLTQTGQLLGTPNYMSPEQVAADPAAIDHRADVYALGVILFELLARQLPYRLEQQPLAEAARLILVQDPPGLGSVNPELRGDLETIVAKALAKDPARRYQSAAALAADLRRWLAHEPILARPPSTLYNLRQFAWRHQALVGGVAATVAALVLGLVGTTLFALREARQRGEAEHNASEALFEAYRGRLAAAAAALAAHDVEVAEQQLDAAPPPLRDWEWHHLHSRLDDSSAVIRLPENGAAFALAAPDRLRLAVWSDQALRVRDLDGGETRTLPIVPGRVRSLHITQSRRGLRVSAWVGDRAFEVLDESGQVLCRGETPRSQVGANHGGIVVSPDDSRLACSWQGGGGLFSRFAVFDAGSGKQTAECAAPAGGIWSYSFSPDGSRLAAGTEDNLARVYDAATGRLVATCRGHTSKVVCVAFHPEGARLVTASSDGTVRQWDAATGKEVETPYDRHSGEVAVARYSPDGLWIASAGTDRTVRVWRATGRQDRAVLHGHKGTVVNLVFSVDGRRLVSASDTPPFNWQKDGTVRVWDVDPDVTLPVLRSHRSYVYPVAYSPDGRWIASGDWDHKVRLCDAATGELCATLRLPGIVPSLAFGPDGTWLVSGTYEDRKLRIWSLETALLHKEIEGPAESFRYVAVSPDGRQIAATAWDGSVGRHRVHVYDSASGEVVFATTVGGASYVLAYSPDGRWLTMADAADGRSMVLLDARTYKTAGRSVGHDQGIFSAAFSPDSRILATGSLDHTVRLWQIDTGASRVLRAHTEEVFAVAFHRDGTRLATAGRDRVIWLWDVKRGEEVARLPGHTSYIWSLAFSPDGKSVVSGSGDTTLRLWDTAPLKARYQARRAADALRPEADRLVARLWQQTNDPAKIVEMLRTDRGLSEPQRHAAQLALLRRIAPPDSE
jgi:WD40 repeat protein/predicted Ser/Thr protein kinase